MSHPTPPPLPPSLREALPDDEAGPIAKIWFDLEGAAPPRPDVPDDATALAALVARFPADRPPPSRRRQDRPAEPGAAPRKKGPLRWAAVALLCTLGLGVWAWHQPVRVAAGPGEQVAVHLPDGSEVLLNSGSRLQYPRGFQTWPLLPDAARTVSLDGEAFFQVAHTDRAFVVEAAGTEVEVLGTQFAVRSRQEAGETRVTLASGRVRVRSGAGAAVLDAPGASARVADTPDAPLRVERVPLEQALAWRSDGFSAIDEPLPAVLAEVERRFAIEVDLEGPVPTGALNLFYPRGATADEILQDLCLAQGCRFWRTSRGFALRMPPTPTP